MGESSETVLGGTYSDAQWQLVVELSERLGVRDRMERTHPHANRDVLLDKLGYSPSWSIENGLMGLIQKWFTTCRRCGATIALAPAESEHLAPLDQHTQWHGWTEGITPDGTKVQP